MASELLIETVAMLRQRIEIRRDYLARNESPTRQLLVDPLLDALGWDFEDSSRLILEFPIGRLRMDYALLIDGRPKVAVEAKRFGTALRGEPTDQVMHYADKASIQYAVVTDGARWIMFDAFAASGSTAEPVMELDLMARNSDETARVAERMSYAVIERERWLDGEFSI